jgi:tetratricopeptide (TPR) repeat protein
MTERREWAPGTTVAGRFVLVRRLGAGSSGEVWRADDLQAHRAVALKRLQLPQLPVARLEREAARAAALQHPRVVRIEGVVRDGAQVCLVQEYLPGGDARRLRGRPWREWVPVLLGVAEALEAAHAADLVHLDLTPGNVLLDEHGGARLADFGVAVAVGSTGEAPGSPYARSPAQWRGEPAVLADDLYGLGALAYEWLSGHPPYYPDIRAARVLAAAPPPPRPAGGAPTPEALVALVVALLQPLAEQRPALAQVREALAALLAAPAAEDSLAGLPVVPSLLLSPLSSSSASPLSLSLPPEPAPPRMPDHEAVPAWRPGGEWQADLNAVPPWWRSPSKVVVAVVGAAAMAGVLLWRPAPLPLTKPENAAASAVALGSAVERATPRARPEQEAVNKVPTDPVALERMAAAKSAADEQRDAYRRQRDALAKLPVAAWGETAWAQAQAVDAAAQKVYDELDFPGAGTQWADGARQLRALSAARGPALSAALSAGQVALAKPDSRAATAAFGKALAIQPGHAGATAGLKRAQTLDEVIHLVDAARVDEQSGREAAAVAGYRRALALDPATTAARAGLARLQQQAGEVRYRGLLASAWQQLGAGKREQARALFTQAGQLRPNASEVVEGLAQVDAGNRSAQLGGLKSRAAAAERGERWAEAEALYAEVLVSEPGLSFATEGRARSSARARLDKQLQGVLDDPTQALRAALRQMARVWLEQAAQQAAPNSRLKQQALGVARLVAAAERPVSLVIQSDGETQLTVLRLKRLGGVAEATVEVLPGKVVVVGTRPGYRDVRREVDVLPDTTPAPLVVRCEERI